MSTGALAGALRDARARLGGSVTWINPEAEALAEVQDTGALVRVGIKDTEAIPVAMAARLTGAPGHLWFTLDRPAPGGRAVDTGLINPLTGRPMTGSTSGGAVNVLEGINDIALGTDGGGSVLGPAMACQLFAVLGAGLGLQGLGQGLSTDGRTFVPGLGLIARSLATVCRGLDLLVGESLAEPLLGGPDGGLSPAGEAALRRVSRVVVPAPGSLTRPDGLDMWAGLQPALERLAAYGIAPVSLDMSGAGERGRALAILAESAGNLVLTLEGPVDWYGLGDSVLGSLGGPALDGQAASGKYLLRAANMVGATAVTLPVGRVSSGFLLVAPPGKAWAESALAAAAALQDVWPVPELIPRYFGPARRRRPGFPRPEGVST
ncbi:MAG TPA: hypothetical protein VGK74_27235 [Symbiobacteriaceae bacterium]|jgi:hypothetical protein